MRAATILAVTAALIGAASAGTVWPKPQTQKTTSDVFGIEPAAFSFDVTGVKSDILTRALARYSNITFPHGWKPSERARVAASRSQPVLSPAANLASMSIKVLTANETLGLQTDESYELTVAAAGATLTANT